jgi:hypothetical protein
LVSIISMILLAVKQFVIRTLKFPTIVPFLDSNKAFG